MITMPTVISMKRVYTILLAGWQAVSSSRYEWGVSMAMKADETEEDETEENVADKTTIKNTMMV